MGKELTEAKRKAIRKYDAANTRQIKLKLNLKTDAELLEWLDHVDNIQGYIKSLIDRDRHISPDIDSMLAEHTGVKVHRY